MRKPNIETHNEDCLIGMNRIKDNSIDMILCDLPYGTTQCKWDTIIPFDQLWAHYKRIIKPNGAIVLNGAEPFSSLLRLSNLDWYKYDWVWDKIKGTGFLNAKRQPMRVHELVHVFYKKQCTYNPQKTYGHERKRTFRASHLQTEVYGEMNQDYHYDSTERYPRSVLEFSTDTQNSSLHPTQKPIALCEYLIKTYSNEGETVLDNTMGSGTTGIACLNTNRNFIGFEMDTPIFQDAMDRINKHQIPSATLFTQPTIIQNKIIRTQKPWE
jgi:site-specific DNA-methyltransferase (adenine-specific)